MDLGWKVTGTSKIYCESSFNVGIGTGNPAAALDVNGNTIIRGTLNVFDGIIIGKSYTGEKALVDTVMASKMESDEMKADQYKTSTITIDGNNSRITSQTGEISFDNNSLYAGSLQVSNLQVTGTTTQSDLIVQNHLQIGNSSLHLSSTDPGTGTDNRFYSTNGDLLIQSQTGSDLNTIINGSNNGHVGIGTLSPQQNLHIKGRTNLNPPVEDETATLSAVIRLEDETYNALFNPSDNRTAYWDIAASAKQKGLYFRTDDGSGTYNHLIMTLRESSGNVGIGTANPIEKLHVMGDQYPVFMMVQNQIGFTKIGFNGAHGIIESDHRLQLNYYSGQDVVVGGQNAGEGSFYSMHNSFLAVDDGKVGIGCVNVPSDGKVAVDGKIYARQVEVNANYWSDYVFEDSYRLLTFEELRLFIENNNHLPDVPTTQEITEDGLNLGDMDAILLKKIEELTLYILELEKEIQNLKNGSEN